MSRWIYKKEILNIFEGKNFDTEEEMEKYVVSKLPSLLKIKPEQIDQQSVTTSFDGTLCNCADIVIRTDDDFKKAILVIELKLTKSVDKFKNSDYTEAVKQLHKYCQDVKSPYGILLTENICFIYKYKYFRYDNEPEREEENRIPNMGKIEDQIALYAFVDFLIHKKSMKYIFYIFLYFFVVLLSMKIFW
jgi:hypothetical protein